MVIAGRQGGVPRPRALRGAPPLLLALSAPERAALPRHVYALPPRRLPRAARRRGDHGALLRVREPEGVHREVPCVEECFPRGTSAANE